MDVREVWEMGPDDSALSAATLADKPTFLRLQGPNFWPALNGYMRSLPSIFKRHHPDLLSSKPRL